MSLRTSLFSTLALTLALAALPACQQSLSYTNIPADQSDVASSDLDGSNTAHLEAAALKAVRQESQPKATVTVLLPKGTRYATYQKVVALAGEGFVLPEAAPVGTPVYEARAIHARSADAKVDVVTPGEIRPLSLTEVNLDLRFEIDGYRWRATSLEPRRIVPAAAVHQAPPPDAKDEKNKWFTDAKEKQPGATGEVAPAQQSEEVKKADEILSEPKPQPAAPAPKVEEAAPESKPAKAKFDA